MKLTWKNKGNSKKRPLTRISNRLNLPFEVPGEVEEDDRANYQDGEANVEAADRREAGTSDSSFSDLKRLAESFQAQGDTLAEDGKFWEALGKWETALTLMPENAVLNEQKAQVLLEVGEAWDALKAATRATDLDPSWAEVQLTLMLRVKYHYSATQFTPSLKILCPFFVFDGFCLGGCYPFNCLFSVANLNLVIHWLHNLGDREKAFCFRFI